MKPEFEYASGSPHYGWHAIEPARLKGLPKMPGAFPSDDQDLVSKSSPETQELACTEIYELPTSALCWELESDSRISDLQASGSPWTPESDSRISDLRIPFDGQSPEFNLTVVPDDLKSLPSQQKKHSRRTDGVELYPNLLGPEFDMLNRVGSSHPKLEQVIRSSSTKSPDGKIRKDSKAAVGIPQKDILIALFGVTGTGKSSFISKLTGQDVKIGHGLNSCTSEIEQVKCKIGPYNVTLVDTPGFDDTTRSDTEILILIASWMKDAYDDETRLNGVIFLHRISDVRMAGSSYKNLKMFRSLCGSVNLSHVMLVTTMWDSVTPELGSFREAELVSEGKFWGGMKEAGSIVRRYDNSGQGATALVSELLEKQPIVLKIQNEIAVQKIKLVNTKAGQSINADLIGFLKKNADELAEVKKDLALAVKQKDAKLQESLEGIRSRLASQMEATEESKRALHRPINRRAWYQISWRCKKCNARLKKNHGSDEKGECPGCGFSQLFV